MNVNDVEFEKPQGDMLESIFSKQRELMEKYHKIEEENGVGYGLIKGQKFDINTTRSQELLKNFAWRVTEEITEAMECSTTDRTHTLEELADALHFLTELCIIVGITPEDIVDFTVDDDRFKALFVKNFEPDPFTVILKLGLACNCLKQRPWKQSHFLTDFKRFRRNIVEAYHALAGLWSSFEVGPEEAYMFYFKKQSVNSFRIASNY